MQINRYGEKTAESKLNKLRGIMSKIRLTRISINSRRVTHVKIDRYGNEIDEYSHNKYGFYLIIFLLNTSQMCLFSLKTCKSSKWESSGWNTAAPIQPLVQNAFCDSKKTVAIGRNRRLRQTRFYFPSVNLSCLSINAIFVAQEKNASETIS